MEEALRALLLTTTAVVARVADRIDFGLRPQGKPEPAIRLTTINDGPMDHSLDGPSLSRARVQIDCFDQDYGAAKITSRAVRTLLDGYSGGVFRGVFLAGARDTDDGEGPTRVHCVSMDFIITYNFTG